MELLIVSNLVTVPVMWDGSIRNFRLAVKGHGMKTRSFKNNFKMWILEEELSKVLETGAALGYDFEGKEVGTFEILAAVKKSLKLGCLKEAKIK